MSYHLIVTKPSQICSCCILLRMYQNANGPRVLFLTKLHVHLLVVYPRHPRYCQWVSDAINFILKSDILQ